MCKVCRQSKEGHSGAGSKGKKVGAERALGN